MTNFNADSTGNVPVCCPKCQKYLITTNRGNYLAIHPFPNRQLQFCIAYRNGSVASIESVDLAVQNQLIETEKLETGKVI